MNPIRITSAQLREIADAVRGHGECSMKPATRRIYERLLKGGCKAGIVIVDNAKLDWLTDFLMNRGVLKMRDARRCAGEILRKLEASND